MLLCVLLECNHNLSQFYLVEGCCYSALDTFESLLIIGVLDETIKDLFFDSLLESCCRNRPGMSQFNSSLCVQPKISEALPDELIVAHFVQPGTLHVFFRVAASLDKEIVKVLP